MGSAQADQGARQVKPIFEGLSRQPEPLAPQTGFLSCEPGNQVEILDVTQGKLCMGFTTGITNRDPAFGAMQMLNTILGAGMTCKLFVNVREKQSLCYSISSSYYSTKGIVTVGAGIDFEKEAQTRREILAQIQACRDGEISDQEMEAARQALYSSLRTVNDSLGAMESYYSTAALSGLNMTPEAYMEAVSRVTKDQVVAAARQMTLHTTYFLKGENQ